MTFPWEVGIVYLSASVESEYTMVDLAGLGLLVGSSTTGGWMKLLHWLQSSLVSTAEALGSESSKT